jgi:transposase
MHRRLKKVNRRQRRAKTDPRMDVGKLARQLVRYWRGEHDVWSVVRVPSPEDEDRRQLHRELEVLKEERKQHRVRIQSLLFTQGIDVQVGAKFPQKLEQVRCWNPRAGAARHEATGSRTSITACNWCRRKFWK